MNPFLQIIRFLKLFLGSPLFCADLPTLILLDKKRGLVTEVV